jgi:hypothetical protein
MDFELNDAQRMTRQLVRELAAKEIAPFAARWDDTCEFPWEVIRKLGGLNLLGTIFPPAYGGAGMDYVAYALVIEELSRVDGSIGIIVASHTSLCANHIYVSGTEAQRQTYLTPLAKG